MDLNNMMALANQLKEKMASAQNEAHKVRVTAEAGAGMVRVVMNGQHEVVELKIEPAAAKGDDLSLLEDLVRAAVNSANAKVAEALKAHMGNMARDMGLDMSAFNPADLFNPGKPK